MSVELTKNLMCVSMRNGAEIWMESEKAEKLQTILGSLTSHMFVRHEGQTINTADVIGVFDAQTMEAVTRRKNGQWKCGYNFWHDRGKMCECRMKDNGCSKCKCRATAYVGAGPDKICMECYQK